MKPFSCIFFTNCFSITKTSVDEGKQVRNFVLPINTPSTDTPFGSAAHAVGTWRGLSLRVDRCAQGCVSRPAASALLHSPPSRGTCEPNEHSQGFRSLRRAERPDVPLSDVHVPAEIQQGNTLLSCFLSDYKQVSFSQSKFLRATCFAFLSFFWRFYCLKWPMREGWDVPPGANTV